MPRKPDPDVPEIHTGDGAIDAIVLDESVDPNLHREVASLEPSQVLVGPWGEVEVVNRTKNNLSPYTPIVKTPTHSENSGTHTGFSVEVRDPASPTGFKHLGNVSASYLLLSNLECHEVAMEVAARSGLDYRPSKVLWDGGRYMEVVEFKDLAHEVEPGDAVRLCLVVRNSYNRAWPLEVTLAAVRAICENGMIAGTHFSRVRFKHVTGNLGGQSLSDVVGEAMRVLETADADLRSFVLGLQTLKALPATHETMGEVRRRVLPTSVIGPQKWGEITDRFYREEEASMFGLLNASTYSTWHGKISASDIAQNEAAVSGLLAYANERQN